MKFDTCSDSHRKAKARKISAQHAFLRELGRSILPLIFIISSNANSGTLEFSGTLDVVQEDNGAAVYSGTPTGTAVSGSIEDTTGSGEITVGTTKTTFSCCSPTSAAGGMEIVNNEPLEAEDAIFLNAFAQSEIFSTGDLIDIVNIEGESSTTTGGRIEIGLSFILKDSAFNNTSASNYPFNSDDVLLQFFFILEEDASADNDIYDAVGKISLVNDPTELPIPGELSARDLDGDPATTEAYYDPALQITWLKNANLAMTETFSVPNISDDGSMDYATAQLWINTMNANAYHGLTGWRLPTLSPVAGGSLFDTRLTNNGTSDLGHAVTGAGWVGTSGSSSSEMGHMYYVTLGNLGQYEPNGNGQDTSRIEQTGWGLKKTGPFLNLEGGDSFYWSGVEDVSSDADTPVAWFFWFAAGLQSFATLDTKSHIWAVHDGDISSAAETDPDESLPQPIDSSPTTPIDAGSDADGSGSSSSGGGGGALGIWLLLIGIMRVGYGVVGSVLFKALCYRKGFSE